MKKGFTLVEMIVVVCILVVISVLVVPKMQKTISNNRLKVCLTNEQTIIELAKEYVYQNSYAVDNYISANGSLTITIETLKEAGLLPNEIKKTTDEEFDSSKSVEVKKNGKIYSYNFESECSE